MSLGIVFKGPEGIVLAADSRVTLNWELKPQQADRPNVVLPSYYDNATKMFSANGQTHVGVVTYGVGAIGSKAPRTAHSFLPEFEANLRRDKAGRLSVESFAEKLSDFYMAQWKANMPAGQKSPEQMMFLIGGFDDGATYGKLFELGIPNSPKPKEWHGNEGEFGAVWGGQKEFADRLIQGYDPHLLEILKHEFEPEEEEVEGLQKLLKQLAVPIPYQFLPLQDCVDLSIFLIRTTISIQKWVMGIRGVGGDIDVATITQAEGFRPVQQKEIKGESRTTGGRQ